MHIPDSAVSPATSLLAAAAMAPVWVASARKARSSLASKQTPHLAIGAAFSFTIMLFNIPVMGGTTAHAVGSVLLAILLGPWAAVLGVTTALVIQALFFGDGGVLALGLNSFTMAFAMPMCGYLAFRAAAGKASPGSARHTLAAGLGGYVGVNVASLLTSVALGIQPWLYHDAAGRALYFPLDLRVALPAMAIPHLTVAGLVEGIVTAMAVRYVVAAGVPLHQAGDQRATGRLSLLWVGLAALVALAPLGLLAKGDAWGEWDAEGLRRQAGYVPAQLASVEEHGWKGFQLLPDYLGDRGPAFYILAGAAGLALTALLVGLLGRLLARRRDEDSAPPPPSSRRQLREGEMPDWLLSSGPAAAPERADDPPKRAASSRFLRRTIEGLAAQLRDTLLAEEWAQRKGLLQAIDPRVKAAALMGFVVLTAVLRSWAALGLLAVVPVAMAWLSMLPVGQYLRRVWLAAPLFVGAVALPAALSVVTPGRALFTVWQHPHVTVTLDGLDVAARLVVRVGVAISFVTLLAATTRWSDLLRAVRALGAPRWFVTIASMTYRYLAVLIQASLELFEARQSRTVGRTSAEQGRRFVGAAIGGLFGKTVALTEEVHAAMEARGWSGEAVTLAAPRARWSDVGWAAAMLVLAAVAVGGEFLG